MKISVDEVELFTISDIQKKIISNDIPLEILEEDLQRRLKFIINEKISRCYDRLKKTWEPVLMTRYDSIPTNPDQFALLVFSQQDYKDRSKRDDEKLNQTNADSDSV